MNEMEQRLARYFPELITEAGGMDPALNPVGTSVDTAPGAGEQAGAAAGQETVPPPGAEEKKPGEEKGMGEEDDKDAKTKELAGKVFEILKSGDANENLLVKYFEKDGAQPNDVKSALRQLEDEGKIDNHKTWFVVAQEMDDKETNVSDDTVEDETEPEEPQEDEMDNQDMAPPGADAQMQGQQAGAGQMPPPLPNAMEADEEDDEYEGEWDDSDEEFDDDIDFDDEEEDDAEINMKSGPMDDDEDDDEDDEKDIDDAIDDLDDIKTLLRTLEPKLRKWKDKTSKAKAAMKNSRRNAYPMRPNAMSSYGRGYYGMGHGKRGDD